MAILTRPTDLDLAAFVEAYPLGALRSARGIEAGTVNTSYLLELESGRFFLRIYEEQDASGAAREARVLRHLAAKGVPTPAPIVAVDGTTTRTVAGKPAALFPWIAGDILCQALVGPSAAEATGAALARIHLAGHAPDAPLDAGRFGPADLAVRCDRVAASRDPDARVLAEPLRAAVMKAALLREQTKGRAPSGLIHGDLFRDNVLWQGVGAREANGAAQTTEGLGRLAPDASSSTSASPTIAALLDFESAHHGPFAYDLAVTILSWSFGSHLDMNLASAIVRGYQSVRELEEGDRSVLYDEAIFAALRFTITRITDDAIRVGKRWQRFVERRESIERLGEKGFLEALGL